MNHDLELKDIFDQLTANIEKYGKSQKSEDKNDEKNRKDIAKCFKIVQAFFLTCMFAWDYRTFLDVFFPEEKPKEEVKEEPAKKGKKGKKAKKEKPENDQVNKKRELDAFKFVQKYLENLCLKVLETKLEK